MGNGRRQRVVGGRNTGTEDSRDERLRRAIRGCLFIERHYEGWKGLMYQEFGGIQEEYFDPWSLLFIANKTLTV
jgi:hypothetical protein